MKKNNKGRVAGSGTVSLVRKERYRLACQERDRLLAEATTEEERKKATPCPKGIAKKAPGPGCQGAVGLQPAVGLQQAAVN